MAESITVVQCEKCKILCTIEGGQLTSNGWLCAECAEHEDVIP